MPHETLSLRSIQSTDEVSEVTTVKGNPIPIVTYGFANDEFTVQLFVTDWDNLYGHSDVIYVEWSHDAP